MKPIALKNVSILLNNRFYWSKAYQSLTISGRNLLMCMVAELKFTGSRKKKTFAYTNNGKVSFTEYEWKKQGLGASQTYLNARNSLIKVGFVICTYRGGRASGDRNTYELLINSELAPQSRQRWRRYPKENWEHEIPKIKEYIVGKETRFKKSNNTLKNQSLNGINLPCGLGSSFKTSLEGKGVTDDILTIKTPVG